MEDELATTKEILGAIERQQQDIRTEARTIDLTNPAELSLRRLESLKQQLEQTWAEHREETTKLEQLTNEHARRVRSLVQHGARIGGNVQRVIRIALLAARSELELAVDSQQLESAAAAQDAIMQEKIAELMGHVENLVPEPKNEGEKPQTA